MLKSDTAFSFLLGEGILSGDVFQKNGVYAETGEEETVEPASGIYSPSRGRRVSDSGDSSGISGS